MARQIAPGTPTTIEAKQYKVPEVDFSAFDKIGDAKINAANNNFKLYAESLISTESNKIYEQFKTNPVALSNALGKLPEMLTDLPPEIQDQMTKKIFLNSVSLVQRAENNKLVEQDRQNQKYAADSIIGSKTLMAQEYQNVLQNHISKAEDKREVSNEIFLQQQMNLNNLADLKNYKGQNVFSESQRKSIINVDDLELEGFKQFFDTMLINDDDDLTQSKDYYTKFILAPERFMEENYMNRDTYDKARAYAEKELKRVGAELDKKQFNQSVKEAMELQIEDLPGKLQSLRDSGRIDTKILDNIEKVNVKFNDIDPSKAESPIAMLELLKIVDSMPNGGVPQTEADQQKIMEQGVATLDAIADYAQTYGLSPEKVRTMRETVVNIETNAAFAPILQNFAQITDNFESKLNLVRRKSTGKSGWSALTSIDGLSDTEELKLFQLNQILAVGTDTINQQIRNGDWEGVRQTQRNVQESAAKIWYDWIDWMAVAQTPDGVIMYEGRPLQFQGFTQDGDIKLKTLD